MCLLINQFDIALNKCFFFNTIIIQIITIKIKCISLFYMYLAECFNPSWSSDNR